MKWQRLTKRKQVTRALSAHIDSNSLSQRFRADPVVLRRPFLLTALISCLIPSALVRADDPVDPWDGTGPFGFLPYGEETEGWEKFNSPFYVHDMIVGYMPILPGINLETSPIINFETGVNVPQNIWVYHDSTLNLKGGFINVAIFKDTSKFNMTGGTCQFIFAEGTNLVNVNGTGTVFSAYARGHSTVNLRSGTVQSATAVDFGEINVDVNLSSGLQAAGNGFARAGGVSISGNVFANDSGTILLNAVNVGGGVFSSQNSHLTATGCSINADANIMDSSVCQINGGSISGNVYASGDSTFTLSGVSVPNGTVNASGHANVSIVDETIGRPVQAIETSSISIFGGTYSATVSARNDAQLSIVSGTFQQEVQSFGFSLVSLSAGTFANLRSAGGTMNILSGTANRLLGTGGTTNMTGGTLASVVLLDGSFNMSGGVVTGNVDCLRDMVMTNGSIQGTLDENSGGHMQLKGGSANEVQIEGGNATIDNFTSPSRLFILGSASAVVNGGQFAGLQVEGNAQVDVNGGDFAGVGIVAGDASEVRFHNGSISFAGSAGGVIRLLGGVVTGDVRSVDQGRGTGYIFVEGGTVQGMAKAESNSAVDMRSGSVSMLASFTDGIAYLAGGTVGELLANDGVVTMTGGHVTGDVTSVFHNGVVTIADGTIDGNLVTLDGGKIIMSGGRVNGGVKLEKDSSLQWYGGFIKNVDGIPSSLSLLNSGAPLTLLDGLYAYDDSTIELFGHLNSILIDPNFNGLFSKYEISGQLTDGSYISGIFVYVQNPTIDVPSTASFHLVTAAIAPEPASCGVITTAVLATLARRKRRPCRIAS